MAQPKKPAPAPAAPSAGKGTIIGIVTAVMTAVMAVIMLPTTIIIVIGLVPSAVAFFVDTSRERLLGATVFSLNVAGVLPALIRLWQHGHHMENAINIITQPSILMMILVPSGIGWLIYIYMPHFISGLMRKKAEYRIRNLERFQEDLVEQWSNAVAHGAAIPAEEKKELPAAVSA